MLTDYDKAHIEEILCGEGDWFTAQLLRLCAKADVENLKALHRAFPVEVDAYVEYIHNTTYLEWAHS